MAGVSCPDGVPLAWHRDPRMLTKRARRSHGRSILLCCHNHTSPVTVRIEKQLQVSTDFVLTSLSSPFVPGRAAFVVTIPLVLLCFVYPQRLRILGCQVFHHSATTMSSRLAASVIQPEVHLYVSKSSSANHQFRGSQNTEPSFSELPLFLRLPSIHSKKTVCRRKAGRHPSDESCPPPWLRLTIEAKAPAEVRFDASTEWVARCQLLSAINRIRSLFPLFARPLSLSVRVLPTLLLLSLIFLSHVQDTSSLFSSLTLINIWLNWVRRLMFPCVTSRQASRFAP